MKPFVIAAIIIVALGLLASPLALLVLSTVIAGAQQQHATQAGLQCAASWQTVDDETPALGSTQLDAAATIYAAALETGAGPEGAVVGIATAMQESALGDNPASLTPNSDGDVGLFQQRSLHGWYANGATAAENAEILLDHGYAARTFFRGNQALNGSRLPGLLDIANWREMSVSQAAQAVQRSAFPGAYAAHENLARALVTQLAGGAAGEVLCSGIVGGDLNCEPSGLSSEIGLQPDALRGLRCIKEHWPQITTIGGMRDDPGSDHHAGNAIDPMIPNYLSPEGRALGTEIAEWARANAEGLGVTYVIWRRQLWSSARADEGWRSCGATASCYSGSDPSAAHLDHVHISFSGNAGSGIAAGGGVITDGSAGLPMAAGSYRLTARHNQAGTMWASGFHTGLDFAAPTGTHVYATTHSTVTSAGWGGAYGNLIKLRADDGTATYYAHLSTMSVSAGQRVRLGQEIGRVGATGNVTGAHLHFEVRVGGVPVDPEAWLARRGVPT